MDARTRAEQVPIIPVLLFAAIDLIVALIMLVSSGFTWPFALIVTIGLGLAGVGFWALYHAPGGD